MQAAQRRFQIPPMADNHKVESTSRSARTDMTLLAMMPHMHLRGKSYFKRLDLNMDDELTEGEIQKAIGKAERQD